MLIIDLILGLLFIIALVSSIIIELQVKKGLVHRKLRAAASAFLFWTIMMNMYVFFIASAFPRWGNIFMVILITYASWGAAWGMLLMTPKKD